MEWLNSLLPGVIKFKYEYSSKKIEFLELELSIENGTLETNLYVKPTNAQLFLDYNSNHPQPCKEGIVHGEALRVIERCSKQEDEQTHLTNLKQKFLDRNYPEKLVDEKFEVAKQNNRKSLIHQNRRKRNYENKVRSIFTHSEANPPIHMWMRQCKQLLTKNEKAKQIGDKIQIGLKQPKNVQSIARNHNKPEEIGPPKTDNPGCFKCNKCKVACPILKEGKHFTSKNTQKTYKIKQNVTCTSGFVIYLASCTKRGGQYVGKSQTDFKRRHSNHKQEIKKKTGGLGHHYGGSGCGYENVSIMIIEQVYPKTAKNLCNREVFWQNQLRVYVQNGGNAHCYKKEKTK